MNEILFGGIRKYIGEKVVGCLDNNMFFYSQFGSITIKYRPAPYIIPNDELSTTAGKI